MNKEVLAGASMAMFTAALLATIILFYGGSSATSSSSDSKTPVAAMAETTPLSVDLLSSAVTADPAVNNGSSSTTTSPSSSPSSSSSTVLPRKSAAIFVIGDSSVDCGENTLFYPLLRRNLSLFPCTNGSDTTLVPHFLAQKLGLPEVPTFYEQNGTIEGILNGLNYGSAQATILTSSDGPSFQSLNQQLRQAYETIQLLQLQLGPDEAEQFTNSSIFYLSIGKDDYLNYFFPNTTSSLDFTGDSQELSRMLVDELTRALRDLYDAGARKIVTMGILPLGCAPRVVVDWYFTRGRNGRARGCVGEINQLIMQHNHHLSERVDDLNLEFSDARFVFCDVFQGISQILTSPRRYGFEDVRGACCGGGWHGAAVGCQSIEMGCNQPLSHVWWDFYNPTEAVNSLLAESAWSGQPLTDICRPFAVRDLVNTS